MEDTDKLEALGRYRLVRRIGRGGMGEVWLAEDPHLLRQVALKVLPFRKRDDEEFLMRFEREARAAAALHHPHILPVHDYGQQQMPDNQAITYLVMSYVSGGSVDDRLKALSNGQGVLTQDEALTYLFQVAEAIDYAHVHNIVHRDIKPANMLLRDDNWLLLTDFGLAKVLGGTMVRGQTYAGSGTPEYMAPEQIMGQALPASDRYSLAVVAYQLFTGSTPFRGSTPTETITQQMQAPLPPPRQLNPRIPVTIENLLIVALSRNPDLRPPSCLALVDALQKAWMTGTQTAPNPDATLLAPWSKRWQEMAASPSRPVVSGEAPSGPSTPTPPGVTSILPGVDEMQSPEARSVQTLTDPNQTSGPPTPHDPFATNTGVSTHGAARVPVTPPYQPGRLERKVGRRPILLGGAVAAAVVIGDGVAGWELVRARSSSHSQNGLTATPTPLPGPRKLIPGEPVLQLTGHSGAVWTASWHPGGRYLLTASEDGYIMLWDIATALQSSIPGSALAVPSRKWTVAGIKFQNITDAVCWSSDGKKLIVGNTFGDKAYVLDTFGSSSAPTVYRDLDLSILDNNAIYTYVAAGPFNDRFTILNGEITGSQAQVWRFGQTDAPAINYDVADGIEVIRWSPDGRYLATSSFDKSVLIWKVDG